MDKHPADSQKAPPPSRWGPEDERGAANLLGSESLSRGLASIDQGKVFSLGIPISPKAVPVASHRQPMAHYMTRSGGDYAAGLAEKGNFGFADDVITLAVHGTSHIDALGHVWRDGLMYNSFPNSHVTSVGARRCGIDKVGPLVTRAIIVDTVPEGSACLPPGHSVTSADLDKRVRASGIEPKPGDALLIRTGWTEWCRKQGPTVDVTSWPGLHPDCSEWIAEHDFALVGSDNMAVEVGPSPYPNDAGPLHVALIRDRGIYLMELLDLSTVAGMGVATGMLVVSPLHIERGTGSPVAPVLII